jgi:hypothetical protein
MRKPIKDIAGNRYGRLVAIRMTEGGKWMFKCDCGVEKEINRWDVCSGKTKSCGCYNSESARNRKKGKFDPNARNRHPLYATWNNMMARCYNPNSTSYKSYGAKGITVSDEWHSFEQFVADMGSKPSPTHSLDRVKSKLGYSKSNCRWATDKEQARNTSNNKIIEYGGESKSLIEWAEQYGLRGDTLNRRLKNGWSIEDALHKPLEEPGRKGEKNPKCKLSEADVKVIFVSNEKYATLAKQYGVGIYTISYIKNKVTWAFATKGLKAGRSQKNRKPKK